MTTQEYLNQEWHREYKLLADFLNAQQFDGAVIQGLMLSFSATMAADGGMDREAFAKQAGEAFDDPGIPRPTQEVGVLQ